MRRTLALAAVVALGCTACGSSSGGVTATAKKGDAFCKLAQVAKADNDALDVVDVSDTAKVKLELGAAIDSLTAAVAKAPKDIADTAKTLLSKEEQLETLLKDNGYDFTKALSSDAGKKLAADKEAKQAGDDFKAYLSEKCGIASSDTSLPDAAPSTT
jgi:hypothetical protein